MTRNDKGMISLVMPESDRVQLPMEIHFLVLVAVVRKELILTLATLVLAIYSKAFLVAVEVASNKAVGLAGAMISRLRLR